MLGTNAVNSAWTDERFELLKSFNGTEMSNAQIANAINAQTGSNFTRNSIIGKRAREGLIQPKPKKEPRTGKHPRNLEHKRRVRLESPDLFTPPEVSPQPLEFLGLSIDELDSEKGRRDCRYPRGDGPFLFCGQPAKEGSSYCEYCRSLCYEKPRQMSEDNRKKAGLRRIKYTVPTIFTINATESSA